jgi:hypothetical protein
VKVSVAVFVPVTLPATVALPLVVSALPLASRSWTVIDVATPVKPAGTWAVHCAGLTAPGVGSGLGAGIGRGSNTGASTPVLGTVAPPTP